MARHCVGGGVDAAGVDSVEGVGRMTQAYERLLAIFTATNEWISRKDLARRMKRPGYQLQKADTIALDRMIQAKQIESHRIRIAPGRVIREYRRIENEQ